METKYVEMFKKLREVKGKAYVLRGNNILVEVIHEEVKTAGGIIIAEVKKQVHGNVRENEGLIGIVLDTGEGYYDEETKETVPMDVSVGDIVLLPKYSLSLYTTFPGVVGSTDNKIGMTLESEIKMIFKGEEGYAAAKVALNG